MSELIGFQILLIITLVILASRDSLSTHFKAEYIHVNMNGVSAGIDSLLGHSNKAQFSGTQKLENHRLQNL